MRNLWSVLVLIGLVVNPASAQNARVSVAVLPFENGGSYGKDKEEFEALSRGIAGILGSELNQRAAVDVIDRARVQRLVDQQAASERIDAATATRIGKQLGARYLVAGTFVDLYGDFRVDARIIDVETGEIAKVVRSDPKLSDRQQMFRIIQSVAERVVDGAKLPAGRAASRPRNVPADAVIAYSRALLYQDRGDTARAAEFFNKAASAPDFAEAREGLRQLRGG